jgi:hypothetical protein
MGDFHTRAVIEFGKESFPDRFDVGRWNGQRAAGI